MRVHEIREAVANWLQVNLILDGSSSPLKYLVNRFRSSTYPGSLQTFDSLRSTLDRSLLTLPLLPFSFLLFHPLVLPIFSLLFDYLSAIVRHLTFSLSLLCPVLVQDKTRRVVRVQSS